jgi:hypothetical protein
MGPKYESEGEDEHGGKWSYAAEGDTTKWRSPEDYRIQDKTHEEGFEYRGSAEHNIHKSDDWPEYKEINSSEGKE